MISKIVSGYQNNFPVITVRQAGPFDSSGWPGLSWIHYRPSLHAHSVPFSPFFFLFNQIPLARTHTITLNSSIKSPQFTWPVSLCCLSVLSHVVSHVRNGGKRQKNRHRMSRILEYLPGSETYGSLVWSQRLLNICSSFRQSLKGAQTQVKQSLRWSPLSNESVIKT